MYVVNNITPNGPKFDLNIVVKFDNETQWFDFFFKNYALQSKRFSGERFQSLKFRRPAWVYLEDLEPLAVTESDWPNSIKRSRNL